MSITVANSQDNRAVFRIFITLLTFSFDSPYLLKGLLPHRKHIIRYKISLLMLLREILWLLSLKMAVRTGH